MRYALPLYPNHLALEKAHNKNPLKSTKAAGAGFSFCWCVIRTMRPRVVYGEVSQMLFLLRLAFWILVICLLLPGAPQDSRRIMTSAQKTVTDVRGFCVRNPDVCEDARSAMTVMLAKLKNGADLLQGWLSPSGSKGSRPSGLYPNMPAPEDPPLAPRGGNQPMQIVPRWGDSLNQSDKAPPWRGPG